MQYYTLRGPCFQTDKVGYNTVITLEVLGVVSGGLVTLSQKMNAEKNKIVLKFVQSWDILMLLFCEIIVR